MGDLNNISSYYDMLAPMDGKNILITGSTGLIGRRLTERLMEYNHRSGGNVRVFCLTRNKEKTDRLFSEYQGDANFSILEHPDIRRELTFGEPVDYLVHAAGVTASGDFVKKPVETIDVTLWGAENMLKLARSKKVKSMVYLSSLEVYGVPDKLHVSEKDFGYLDPLQVRSSYSEGKRMAECLCKAYHSEYGVPVKIVRLTQTFGRGTDGTDPRVFAEFIRNALEGRDIVLNTAGETLRPYCGVGDAAGGILTVLMRGEEAAAYNLANPSTAVTILELAELVKKLINDSIRIIIRESEEEIRRKGYNPVLKIALETEKLQRLGWEPRETMEQMILEAAESLKNSMREDRECERAGE